MNNKGNTENGTIDWYDFKVKYAAASDAGSVRDTNQDGFLVLSHEAVFCVVDGAGGHSDGLKAANMTLDGIKALMRPDSSGDYTVPLSLFDNSSPHPLLERAIRYANRIVFREKKKCDMASTVVACHYCRNSLWIAHVGDSRFYLWRRNKLIQQTRDHSLVRQLYEQGIISKNEMGSHPRRNVLTRAIGVEREVHVDTKQLTPEIGDIFMLCSDGLSVMVSDEKIEELFCTHSNTPVEVLAERLILTANKNGGRDNITVVLMQIISE